MSDHEILPLDGDSLAVVIGTPDDTAFWRLVIIRAWDDEWFYEAGDPFDGQQWAEVESQWASYVRERVAPPEWQSYVWRDDDGETERLERADPSDLSTFTAALVTALPQVADHG